ncbi:Epidermal retinol dehydrogenase 2 [Oopsacas minuta]|uniref:Short-chain dehydrogenase/reductase 3 n=1 Tax=Oopsacas minuta TaxID=111878 RepID=A0AAV7JRU8_9METZ|nr:Epidermal retinol dehydrogenase 2 [Oopsacas minuta]
MLKLFLLAILALIIAPLKAIYRWTTYCRKPPLHDKHFSKEIVLVTGGAQGIGRLIADNFALTTATVIIWDINEQQLDKTVAEMRGNGHTAYGYHVDVSDLDQLLTSYERVVEEVGQVTVLVNNAGIVSGKSIFDISLEQFELVIRVNLHAMIHLTKAVIPHMLKLNHGYIINIASVVSYFGYAKLSDYCASKAGARAFSEALQSELYCMDKTGISVTCVCPYKIDTGMFTGVRLKHNWLFPALQPKYVADRVYFGARNLKGGKPPKEHPSIFPGVPKSVFKQVTSAPRPTSSTSESRAKKVQAANEAADKIQDFDHFSAKISSYFPGFDVIKARKTCTYQELTLLDKLSSSSFIYNKSVSPFGFLFLNRVDKDGIEVSKRPFPLQKNSLLSKWSQIGYITDQVNAYEYTSQEILEHAISQLCKITEAHELARFTFLLSQLCLIFKPPDGRRFDTDNMIFAVQLHNIPPNAYKMVRRPA